ncbi:hypothetical protein D3C78_1085080 [compost metagenome]
MAARRGRRSTSGPDRRAAGRRGGALAVRMQDGRVSCGRRAAADLVLQGERGRCRLARDLRWPGRRRSGLGDRRGLHADGGAEALQGIAIAHGLIVAKPLLQHRARLGEQLFQPLRVQPEQPGEARLHLLPAEALEHLAPEHHRIHCIRHRHFSLGSISPVAHQVPEGWQSGPPSVWGNPPQNRPASLQAFISRRCGHAFRAARRQRRAS